jgi:hypothetical protein
MSGLNGKTWCRVTPPLDTGYSAKRPALAGHPDAVVHGQGRSISRPRCCAGSSPRVAKLSSASSLKQGEPPGCGAQLARPTGFSRMTLSSALRATPRKCQSSQSCCLGLSPRANLASTRKNGSGFTERAQKSFSKSVIGNWSTSKLASFARVASRSPPANGSLDNKRAGESRSAARFWNKRATTQTHGKPRKRVPRPRQYRSPRCSYV